MRREALIPEMLLRVGRQHSQKPAVVGPDRRVTYAELLQQVERTAQILYGAGRRPGETVGLLLPNSVEFVAGYFGILRLGGIVVPFNEHYQVNELQHLLERCDVSSVVTTVSYEPLCSQVAGQLDHECDVLLVEDWIDTEPCRGIEVPFPEDLDPEAPVMYQFSSGSTGQPKQIGRSHSRLLFELASLGETLNLSPEDRFLGVAPFSHVNGLMRSMMACLSAGATLYPLPRFDRNAVARTVEQNRITVFIAVPFMFSILAKTPFSPHPDFSSLRLCVSASAPMPVDLNRLFHEKFGTFVRQLYGSTETGTISVNLDEGIEETLDSVGRPIKGVEVEVFDENLQPVVDGEIGEFAVKSPAAIREYVAAEEINKEVFASGYFLTGDLGRRGGGRLHLLGRKKFFINKGGYKINPGEIEELLERHPAVEEAAVVGIPTRLGDEKIKAVVVGKGKCSAANIIEFCRGQVADFKIPSLVEFVKELPKTSTGKIRKKMLIDR